MGGYPAHRGLALGVFLMKQFAETIPTEILEAARVDGAGEVRTFLTLSLIHI